MNLQIHCTPEGVHTYPLHKHPHPEIMLYLEGNGYMKTPSENLSFSPGSIIIIPPFIEHGSTSDNGFKNISISGDFEYLLNISQPVSLKDNDKKEGALLASLIYDNRYGSINYVNSLCSAYIHFLLQHIQYKNSLQEAIARIRSEIAHHCTDPNWDLQHALQTSGYAVDYIRVQFKQVTGMTPTEFLHKTRIEQARFLLTIYRNSVSITQIAMQCGYTDYVHFSRKFKQMVGHTPTDYLKVLL